MQKITRASKEKVKLSAERSGATEKGQMQLEERLGASREKVKSNKKRVR